GNATEIAYAAATRVPSILAGSIIPFLVATVFVIARLYSRGIVTRNWGHDDTWITISWILALGLVTISCLFTKYGSGRHQKTVPLTDVVPQLKLALAQRLVYQLALGTTKISLCYFYLRIFTNNASDKRVPYAIMAFASCYAVALFFVTVFGCTPPSDIWSLAPAGRCTGAYGRLVVIYTLGALNIATDILLLVFAIPKILSLQMAMGQKVALLLVMPMSIMVIVAAIFRMVLSAKTQHSKDFSWEGIDYTIWTGVEVNAGLFCASAPAIKPLLRNFAPGLLSSSNGRRTSYNRSGKRAYGQVSRFGRSDITSWRRGGTRSDRIELQSQDLENGSREDGSAVLTNKVWRGDVPPGGDSESERRVLGRVDGPGDIRKTVDITVSEQRREATDESHEGSESSVKKFEHV
ncbi:hypothetical protein LARI1_G005173, partial [Lachnellula arida]